MTKWTATGTANTCAFSLANPLISTSKADMHVASVNYCQSLLCVLSTASSLRRMTQPTAWKAARIPNTCAFSTASSFTSKATPDGPAASSECCSVQLLASSWGRWGVPGGVQGPLPCLLQVWQTRPLGPELHRLPARRPSKPCAL